MLPPGFYIPDAPPPSPGGGVIDIDPLALKKLKDALTAAAQELESDRFRDVQLDNSVFGDCPSGTELGTEHATAHAIIADTIQGVVTDLWGYHEGVVLFETGMNTADEVAASDLAQQQQGVDALQTSVAVDHGQQSYRNSQVNHLPPGANQGQGAGEGAGQGTGQGDGGEVG